MFKKLFTGSGKDAEPSRPFLREDRGGLVVWRFTLAASGVNVFFTGRRGGVSDSPYDSLNLGFHVDDDAELVNKNRAILSNELGIEAGRITSPRQKHTVIVKNLQNEDEAGSGASCEESLFDPCDGIVTSLKNVPLLLSFADCAPIVLTGQSDEDEKVLAVLHAGRKGMIEGVVGNGVDLVRDRYGIAPESLVAAIGPAIGACCYQVDEGIAAEFAERFGPDVIARTDEGVWLDMQSAAEKALLDAGLLPEKIHVLEICTCCSSEDFFSYRRNGITGRHGAIAWIEGKNDPAQDV